MQLPRAFACVLAASWVAAAAAEGGSPAPAPAEGSGSAAVAVEGGKEKEKAGEILCTVVASEGGEPSQLLCDGKSFITDGEHLEEPGTRKWWMNLVMASACVCVAAFAAGLTLGIMSLDAFQLRVLCNRSIQDVEPGTPRTRKSEQERLTAEQAYAQKILPVISGQFFSGRCPHRFNPSNNHYLLVTLLLTNAMANEALPIFLDGLVPSWLAVLLSVTVVLLFGEILPSAVFTGPNQLKLAAFLVPVIRMLRRVYVPVVLPISLALDVCLGHEEDDHDRGEMKALARTLGELHGPEVKMIHGVLEMHAKAPAEISRPLTSAKMLAGDTIVNQDTIDRLVAWGHSRIFVYRRDPEDAERRDDIMGVLLVKKLLGTALDEGTRVDSCTQALKEPIVLGPDDNLLFTLNKFQEGMCHLAVVSDAPGLMLDALQQGKSAPATARPKLFCSLEDVIEAMMNEKIFDEADVEMGRARTETGASDRLFARSDSLNSRRIRKIT